MIKDLKAYKIYYFFFLLCIIVYDSYSMELTEQSKNNSSKNEYLAMYLADLNNLYDSNKNQMKEHVTNAIVIKKKTINYLNELIKKDSPQNLKIQLNRHKNILISLEHALQIISSE